MYGLPTSPLGSPGLNANSLLENSEDRPQGKATTTNMPSPNPKFLSAILKIDFWYLTEELIYGLRSQKDLGSHYRAAIPWVYLSRARYFIFLSRAQLCGPFTAQPQWMPFIQTTVETAPLELCTAAAHLSIALLWNVELLSCHRCWLWRLIDNIVFKVLGVY